MDTYLRSTAMWYGGVGLLTAQVLRSLALPPKYFRLIVLEIETMGVRSLGPVLTAILVGGKVASGITAELGSMKVTEQIDALRTLGVNYIKRLIVPRVIAALLVFPLLTVMADCLGVLG